MNNYKKICLSLFLFVSLFILSFYSFKNERLVKAEEPNVSLKSFATGWNNLIINGYSENILTFSENLGSAADPLNLLSINENDIGNKVTFNGTPFLDLYNNDRNVSIDYAHGSGYLHFKIPVSLLDSTNEYPIPTIEIESGTLFMNKVLPEIVLFFENGSWYIKQNISLNTISWNNYDYSAGHPENYGETTTYVGESPCTMPINGRCFLVKFTGFAFSNNPISTNMIDNYYISNGIFVNDISIKDIEGAYIDYVTGQTYLFIYVPNVSESIFVKIKAGSMFLGGILEEDIEVHSNRSIGGSWYIPNRLYNQEVVYHGIVGETNDYGWDDREANATLNASIFMFSSNGINDTPLATSGDFTQSDNTLIQPNNDISSITINGVNFLSLSSQGASISYSSAANGGILVYYPKSSLIPTDEYPITTLHIPEGTIICDSYIHETTLYYIDAHWTEKAQINVSIKKVVDGWNNRDENGDFILFLDAKPGSDVDTTHNLASNTKYSLSTKMTVTSSDGIKRTMNDLYLLNTSTIVSYSQRNSYLHFHIPKEYLTEGTIIEIEEGATFQSAILSGIKYKFIGNKIYLMGPKYESIEWNNTTYNDSIPSCLLIKYDKNIVASGLAIRYDDSSLSNLRNNTIVTLNGVSKSISSIEGSEISLPLGGQFVMVYLPSEYMVQGVSVEIKNDTIINDLIISGCKFYLNNSKWYTESYIGIAPGWNNVLNGNNLATVLQFSDYFVENGAPIYANMVNNLENKIFINGVSLSDIEGAYFGYDHGKNYLWFYVPKDTEAFNITDSYPITEFRILADTEVLDKTLPEVKLYLKDNEWTSENLKAILIHNGSDSISYNFSNSLVLNQQFFMSLFDGLQPVEYTVYVKGTPINVIGAQEIKINDNSVIYNPTLIDFSTTYGASIRLDSNGNNGLRFGSELSLSDYENLVSIYGKENVKCGTYILPYSYIKNSSYIEYFKNPDNSEENNDYIKIENSKDGEIGIFNKTNYQELNLIKYYASLVDIKDSNLTKKFAGIGYIEIIVNGISYYIYGSYNILNNSRSVIEVAKAALNDLCVDYSDTELEILYNYVDSIVNINYSKENILSILNSTERDDYISSISYFYNDGEYFISSTREIKAVYINDVKVNVTINNNSFTLDEDYLKNNFGSTFKYGIGEPSYEMVGIGNEKGNNDFLSEFSNAMGVKSYRIWIYGNMYGDNGTGNIVIYDNDQINKLHDFVGKLVDNGIEEISIMGTYIYPYEGKTFYCLNEYTGEYVFVSTKEYNEYLQQGINLIPKQMCTSVIPYDDDVLYARFLENVYKYYKVLGEEINSWGYDCKFYFEGINEPELSIHKSVSFGTNYEIIPTAYFKTEELAAILVDMSYEMSRALKGINENFEIATPALTNFGESGAPGSGISAITLLDDMYKEIASRDDNVINNYFTALNWHPYLVWFSSENEDVYYFYDSTSDKSQQKVNENYVNDWLAFNENFYSIALNNGDIDKPRVLFTEFGVSDYEGINYGSSSPFTKAKVNEETSAKIFSSIIKEMPSLSYSDFITLFAFRICDTTNGINYGENNFGMVEIDGSLKPIGKEYYQIVHDGSVDYSNVNNVINKYYK